MRRNFLAVCSCVLACGGGVAKPAEVALPGRAPAAPNAVAPSSEPEPVVAPRAKEDAEELLSLAERERALAMSLRLPPIRPDSGREAFTAYFRGPASDWHRERYGAALLAHDFYRRAAEAAPSGEMELDAWLAAATMWAELVVGYRAVPYPRMWDARGESGFEGPNNGPPLLWSELKATFLAQLDAVSQPLLEKSIAAHKRCHATALRHQIFDERALRCIAWLTKQLPNEYVPIQEFRSAPQRFSPRRFRVEPLPDPREPRP